LEETELRPNHWFKKAQRLCKELYEDCHYEENVKAVADFVAEVEDTAKLVQSQEVCCISDTIEKLLMIISVERNWQREEKQGEKKFAPKEAESGR
jgi:hypothetical protein